MEICIDSQWYISSFVKYIDFFRTEYIDDEYVCAGTDGVYSHPEPNREKFVMHGPLKQNLILYVRTRILYYLNCYINLCKYESYDLHYSPTITFKC